MTWLTQEGPMTYYVSISLRNPVGLPGLRQPRITQGGLPFLNCLLMSVADVLLVLAAPVVAARPGTDAPSGKGI